MKSGQLADFYTNRKTYWALLNRLPYNRKMPALQIDGKFVSDFHEKAKIFKNFFSSIYTATENASPLPSCLYRKNTTISALTFWKCIINI